MALTFDEKIAIAKLKAEGIAPHSIAKKLGMPRDRIYRALKSDEELQRLCDELSTECDGEKKTAAENAKQALKDLYRMISERKRQTMRQK